MTPRPELDPRSPTAWSSHVVSDFDWTRLRSVPRPPADPGQDHTAALLTAAVTATHAELLASGNNAAAFATAWVRVPSDPQLHILVGASPLLPLRGEPSDPATGEHPVVYPPGAVGVPVPGSTVAQLLGTLPHWLRCVGQPDALLALDPSGRPDPRAGLGRASFDDYAAHLSGPFAWLVVAEPLPRTAIETERLALATRIPSLRRRENSEQDRLELERAQSRYRELTRARASGVWSVSVLVGGATPSGLQRAAALLCSAVHTDDLPYGLLPLDDVGPLERIWATPVDRAEDGRSPFTATAELVSALARPPARELPGIRLVTRHHFDVTPEALDDGLPLGDVLDATLGPVGALRVPTSTLNRHGFICGATGSGKSQTTRSLLERLATAPTPIPWLVIEPAKAEYARMSGRLGPDHSVLVIRPGEPDVPPASLNPLEPEPGFPLQSHADLVRALFLAAFEANEPFPQVLSRALTQCYTDAGWDLVTSTPRPEHKPRLYVDERNVPAQPRYPTLRDLQNTARAVVDNIGYGKEVAADVRGFVDVRMGSLREGRPGRFFEGGHPLDMEALLTGNVVLELESLTNDQDKSFLIGAVLIRVVEHLRVKYGDTGASGLQHVLVIEEAHRLLKNVHDGPAAAAVELFASLLAEIRAYGEGVLVVEQIPSKILPDVIKNTALKVMHRLPAADDRESVGQTMNLQPEQSEAVVALPPGLAAVAVDGADRPLLVRMTPGEDRETAAQAITDPPIGRQRRSPLCGSDCHTRACTLREMSDAEQDSHQALTVIWTEAAAASLVIGLTPPSPTEHLRARLPGPGRTRDCLLSHAAERAAAARRAGLRDDVDPGDFTRQLHQVLVCQLKATTAQYDRYRWQVGRYRVAGPMEALSAAVRRLGDDQAVAAPPHPLTRTWARRGLALTAPTLAGQQQQLLHHPYSQQDHAVALGDVRLSGLTDAVRRTSGRTDADGFGTALRTAVAGEHLNRLITVCGDMLQPAQPAPKA
jgi:hypothetical protein